MAQQPWEWHQAYELAEHQLVQIRTPSGFGTGFLLYRSTGTNLCAIATAAHVVQDAHYWEQPIRITHFKTNSSVLVRASERAIVLDESGDTAAVLVDCANELRVPPAPIPLLHRDHVLKPGVTIGWVGFPGFFQKQPCFFEGAVSCWAPDAGFYLVDGVAINGVSGSPALWLCPNHVEVIGVVSAYWANRQHGEALPGLSIVRGVRELHNQIETFRSLDEANRRQTPPQDVQHAVRPSPAEMPDPPNAIEGPQPATPDDPR